ncbi:hypothetical protein O181_067293 [Austropuccinia psidii MF-1]|uniref:Uncharacterized protein n=1 Tax=Austropuccinia psidii MF-1 TaxID=1389203 RepID=A0A9Q3EYJ5_9BASI|nr:hypothetical protein [Austropuccinia psidii MF-1]
MINMKILRKCGGELEHAIKCGFVELCLTGDYLNSIGDIITRKIIGNTWIRKPMESKIVPKTSIEDRRPKIPALKCHECGSNSHLESTCNKAAKINEA